MKNLIVLQSSVYDTNNEIIMEHYPTRVELFKSIHNKTNFGNLWAVDEILFYENTVEIYKFLPPELLDMVIISTIFKFLKNHMFKKATKMISQKRHYIIFFFKQIFGIEYQWEKYNDILYTDNTVEMQAKISKSLFLIDTIHNEVFKSLNNAESKYILNEILFNHTRTLENSNNLYPWSFVSGMEISYLRYPRQHYVEMTILEIPRPFLQFNQLEFETFTIGQTFADIIWAQGKYEHSTGFFKAQKLMWPIIPFMFMQENTTINLDLNKEWKSRMEWEGFEQFYKLIYGVNATIFFVSSSDDDDDYHLFHF